MGHRWVGTNELVLVQGTIMGRNKVDGSKEPPPRSAYRKDGNALCLIEGECLIKQP